MSDWIKEVAALNCKEVIERIAGVTFNRNGKTHCPLPGHIEKTPSFSLVKSTNKWKCFGCEQGGDCIDFAAKFKGVDNTEAAKYLADLYGVSRAVSNGKRKVDKVTVKPAQPPQEPNVRLRTDITEYIKACEQDIERTDYFKKRSLTEATIKHFHLGYDAKKDCVVIPYSSKLDYYQTRSVEVKKFYKPPTEQAGQEPIYNIAVLKKGGYIFVVESAICAMSIVQCGGSAIALGGTGIQKLLSEAKDSKDKCTFILCLDNDDAGQKVQQDLANQLFELSAKFIPFDIAGKLKDPNALLMAEPEQLTKNIAAAVKAAREKFRTGKDPISFDELSKMDLPPIKWAFEKLIGEGLAMIASAPKIGKSWMALEMCFAVARGEDYLGFKGTKMGSLYYALEDNLQSAQWRINTYAGRNPKPKNAHVVIDCDKTDTGFFERLKSQIEEMPDVGFVVVDTFQSIRGKEIRKNDVYGNDVAELKMIKKFALDNKICIVLVHHLRKAKEESDIFNNILGSTGIWGTIDSGIMLAKKKEEDAETQLRVKGRGIPAKSLVITLDESTFHWGLIGSPEEQEQKRRKDLYENNIVVRTVKHLLSKSPYGWTGTATQLLMEACDMDGMMPAESPKSIGKTLADLKLKLYADGICHEEKRSGKERKHQFWKKGFRTPQQSFIDSGDKNEE